MSGMRGDLTDFYRIASCCEYNVLIITETWLKAEHLDSEILNSNWQIFRHDRSLKESEDRGGGVLIAVHISLSALLVSLDFEDFNFNLSQQIWVKITVPNKNIFIGCVYIHPNQKLDIYGKNLNYFSKIVDIMDDADDFFIFGDFNLPKLKWVECEDNKHLYDPVNLVTEEQYAVIDFFANCGMNQICNLKNVYNNILDLVFTNVLDNFVLSETVPLISSKTSVFHKVFEVNYIYADIRSAQVKESTLKYNFKKADYIAINHYLSSINWSMVEDDVDLLSDLFIAEILSIIDMFVPKKLITTSNAPPWHDKVIINLRNKRNRSHKKWCRTRDLRDFDMFLVRKKQYDEYDKVCYEKYVEKAGFQLKSDPRSFYKFINLKRNVSVFPSVMKFEGTEFTDKPDIGNKYAEFFKSVYSTPITFDKDNFAHVPTDIVNLSIVNIDLVDIVNSLKSLDENKGAGPDTIPPIFLKRTADLIAIPLHFLFNHSLQSGKFPKNWRSSFLIPIFKSGDKSDIKNYRGVAILSAVPKLFEKLVTQKLYTAFMDHIDINQHGFVKGRSTTTNLVDYTSYILQNMENGNQIDSIYTDFSKAFDKIDHNLLIFKLNKLGINGALLTWIKSYLSGRKQFVKYLGVLSNAISVTSGVPQGSHLGPLLFIIFINDLTNFLENIKFLLYADDLKLYTVVNSINDKLLLQRNLTALQKWCMLNGMVLNAKKCNVISFSRKKSANYYDYDIEGSMLQRKNLINDLGVLLDSKLTFKQHIDMVYSKSKKMLGFIKRRGREFDDPFIIKSLYCALVRSILEYCSVVWMPFFECDVKKLESVQKQFLLYALRSLNWREGFNLPSYTDRLGLLKINTLRCRRDVAAAVFSFDLIKNNINSNYLCSKISVNPNIRNLRHTPYLKVYHHSSLYCQNEPFNRCSKIFNKFYKFFDNSINRDTFKKRVLNALL